MKPASFRIQPTRASDLPGYIPTKENTAWLHLSGGTGMALASWERRAYRQRVRQAAAAEARNARRQPGRGQLRRDHSVAGRKLRRVNAFSDVLRSLCAKLYDRRPTLEPVRELLESIDAGTVTVTYVGAHKFNETHWYRSSNGDMLAVCVEFGEVEYVDAVKLAACQGFKSRVFTFSDGTLPEDLHLYRFRNPDRFGASRFAP